MRSPTQVEDVTSPRQRKTMDHWNLECYAGSCPAFSTTCTDRVDMVEAATCHATYGSAGYSACRSTAGETLVKLMRVHIYCSL